MSAAAKSMHAYLEAITPHVPRPEHPSVDAYDDMVAKQIDSMSPAEFDEACRATELKLRIALARKS